MILDAGIAVFSRKPQNKATGDIPNEAPVKYLETWYGVRNVGARRFFEARQAGERIDEMIRILRPAPASEVWADDECVLPEKGTYKVVQVQSLRDAEAGEDVMDISLERMEGIWE